MSYIAQIILNSLIAGSLYALVASRFSLMYSTNRFMNFALGGVVVVASF